MTDELIFRARQNCCRLCLAPDSECVPIFTSLAADKEPLSSKINACVNIKVNHVDRLSSRICHSCISYLNSWQSFKNRCLAAQMKQQSWLDMAKNSVRRQIDQIRASRNNLTITRPPFKHRPMPYPIIIKTEPPDESDIKEEQEYEEGEHTLKVDLDPSQFLAGTGEYEEDENEDESLLQPSSIMNEEPQILTSLGLTHINSINPYSYMSGESNDGNHSGVSRNRNSSRDHTSVGVKTLPTCRICKLAFSSRANARRHERNIHGKIINPEIPHITVKAPTTKPVVPMTPEMMGIFDYKTPTKYRHLLTDQKLVFIRRNEEFLKQYQTMTCICCDKLFNTYKHFMAHMRKKYQNLSRNLCFKCLKQFQSKAMFVSHLKKKNCINLYKLYLSDDSIPKTGPLNLSPDKMGTKELLTNKVYECKLCTKTFRLKMEFRSHVYDQHSECQKKDVPPGICGFCGEEIDDPMTRRRHYNNMECIVVLHCGTCEEKFDNHQKFIDHVYGVHLPQAAANNNQDESIVKDEKKVISSTPNTAEIRVKQDSTSELKFPQTCTICGQHYNNYYNVLRHMEAKHPDQLPNTYACDKCEAGFPRQSSLREHMYDVHGTTLPRNRRENNFFCRMCFQGFDTKEKWITHQSDQHSRYTCCQCNYQNKSLEEFKNHIEAHPQLASSNPTTATITDKENDLLSMTNGGNEGDDEQDEEIEDDSDLLVENPAKKPRLDNNMKECNICHSLFNSNLGLSNHMRAHYSQEQAKRSRSSTSKIVNIKTATPNGTPVAIKNESGGLAGDARFRRMRCRMCQKRFSTKKSYRRHMLVDHQIRNVNFIKCGVCKAEFTHEKGLKVHMFKVHGTIVTSDSIEIQFECEVCGIVYRNEDQLNAHKTSVHGMEFEDDDDIPTPAAPSNEVTYWFQCRYCHSHFDSNKKLAIHVNSHEEFDSNDYSCKDCGNVYSGRKSLWVHRYKKHPQIPDPSKCEFCNKIFFDKKMLLLHLKSHKESDALAQIEKLKYDIQESDERQLVNEDDEEETIDDGCADQQIDQITCSVCNVEFNDQDLFNKHMQMHEIDMYSDNPLAAMFDTGPEDPNQFYMSRMGDNGEYLCDICPKTFPMLTALKVHRNWHFRSDGKQIPADPNIVWRGLPKKKVRSIGANLKCQYCNSTFINDNNLRRHMNELHKREIGNGSDSPKIFIEKYLECQKCEMKFQTNYEWVDHKMGHARACKPDATFEWGCEICGKLVSRKERLLQHMSVHLKDEEANGSVISGDQGNSEMGFESNSQDSGTSSNNGQNRGNDATASESEKYSNDRTEYEPGENIAHEEEIIDDRNGEEEEDEEDQDQERDDESEDFAPDEDGREEIRYDENSSQQYEDQTADDNEQEDEEEEDDEDQEQDEPENIPSYSCDLCQVFFETSKQLRRHVTSHFLNGPGSVTLTEIPKDKTKIRVDNDITTITPV